MRAFDLLCVHVCVLWLCVAVNLFGCVVVVMWCAQLDVCVCVCLFVRKIVNELVSALIR